ncbi:PaaI family thioesterase, partial [Streptomyces sp. SID10244]|nr:PaaI family thioesterase [Streptomyces sp. SID10244]
MNIRYLRAVTTGVASARSRIVHSGRRSVIVQVDVYATESDELAVMATANFAKTPRTDR